MLFLSDTYEGKMHDKAICDEEGCHYGEGIELGVDLGYLGYAPEGVMIIIAEKKPRNKELTAEQQVNNRKKSRERVVSEHSNAGIKRLRILKDRLRLKLYKYRDQLMAIGCALHNLRVRSPLRNYKPRTQYLRV